MKKKKQYLRSQLFDQTTTTRITKKKTGEGYMQIRVHTKKITCQNPR